MTNSALLEAIYEIIDEEIDIFLSEDEALTLSDKRRKEFLKVIGSNPPRHNSAGKLQEAPQGQPGGPPPEGDKTPVDASPDMGAPMTAGAPGGPSPGDMGSAIGDAGAAPMGAPGTGIDTTASGGGGGGSPPPDGSDPTMGGEEMGGDMGGGGAGGVGGLSGGFGGGGGGGGGGGDLGDGEGGEGGEAPAGPTPSYDPFKDAKTVEDKVQVIMDTANEIAEQTQDPQKILKAVKGLIQNGFSNPTQAAEVIADLFDTDNPVLQQVSRRLNLFMTGQ